MRIRVVIADDEGPALAKLQNILRRLDSVEIVGEASSGQAAVDVIRTSRPDVAFLDIRMPQGDGLSVVSSLPDPPEIVFVTAYSRHALAAFECQAFDYLLKPYTAARVESVIARLEEKLKVERLAEFVRGEVQVAPEPAPLAGNRLILKTGSEMTIIAVADVECALAEGNYLHIMTSKRKFFVRGVLSSLDHILQGEAFLRIHRSAIVNASRIASISLASRVLMTASGFKLPISRARIDALLAAVKSLNIPILGTRAVK